MVNEPIPSPPPVTDKEYPTLIDKNNTKPKENVRLTKIQPTPPKHKLYWKLHQNNCMKNNQK